MKSQLISFSLTWQSTKKGSTAGRVFILDSHLLSIWSDQRLSPSFCSRHLSNTSSTPSTLTSAPTESERWAMMLGGVRWWWWWWWGGYTCELSRARRSPSGSYFVFVYFFLSFFWRSLLSGPVKSCPPGGRSGAGMLTRAAASVNPAHW